MSDAMERIQQNFAKKKEDEAYRHHQNYIKWKLEFAEAEQRAREFKAYWERRAQDDRDLWRDKLSPLPFLFFVLFSRKGMVLLVDARALDLTTKDFANAVDKMSRAGYKGQYGHHDVPEEDKIKLDALYMQATTGDYDGNDSLKCAEEWKLLAGKTKIDAQREFIHMTNQMITRYGWNPPEGWV